MTRGEPERWFEVWGADHGDEFVAILRRKAESWPATEDLTPLHTGGWQREGFVITYADMSDPTASAVVASFRADFDGQLVLAAKVSPEHVDQAGFFEDEQPPGEPPVQIAAGDAAQCARATAAWFRERIFGQQPAAAASASGALSFDWEASRQPVLYRRSTSRAYARGTGVAPSHSQPQPGRGV